MPTPREMSRGLNDVLAMSLSGYHDKMDAGSYDYALIVAYAAKLAAAPLPSTPPSSTWSNPEWEPAAMLQAASTAKDGAKAGFKCCFGHTVHVRPYTKGGVNRDEVWMVMHLLYIACDFGLRKLPDAERWAPEVAYLRAALADAEKRGDDEMWGEVLDCLEVAGPGLGPQVVASVETSRNKLAN